MTDAEMTLLTKNKELERFRNDTIVLKQEKIEIEKIIRETNVSQDNQIEEFITNIIELKN